VTSSIATVNINTPAVITVQPTASQTLCTGTALTLSVTATGTGLSYQWKKGGSNITGANSSSYSIASVATTDAGTYSVDVTSSGVCAPATVTSSSALVNVNLVPTGTSVASGTYEVCSGSTLNITPASDVIGTTFTWTGNNGSGGTGLINDKPINTGTSPIDITYTVIPTGPGVTFCIGTAFTIVVTVNPIPSITNSVLSTTMCSGAGALSFTPTINISGASYSWTSTVVSGTFTGVTTGPVNNSSITDNPINTGNSIGLIRYRITPTGPAPTSCVGNFVDYVVTVNPSPVFSITNNSGTICSGAVTDITITSPTVNGVVTLTSINYGGALGGTQVSGNTFTAGQKIAETLFNPGNTPLTVSYTFTAGANGCFDPTPQSTSITLDAAPVITDAAAQLQTTICSGTTLNFLPTSSTGVTTTYTWTSTFTGSLSGVSSSGSNSITDTPVNTGNTVGVITYKITPAFNSCFGSPVNYIVKVSPTPDVSASSQIICSGTSPMISISNPNNVTGTSFSWSITSSINVSGALAGTGNIINQLLTSTDGINLGSVDYSITPVASSCAGSPIVVSVIVNPIPVITNTATQLQATICSGASLSFLPTSSISGTNFNWSSNVSGPISGVSPNGTGIISDTPVNTGNITGTITYHITPSNGTCIGVAKDYVVTVNPVPTANGNNLTICAGQTASIVINAGPTNVAATTFSWIVIPSANVTGAFADNGSTIIQTLSLTDYNVGTVTYRITPTANNCNGPTKDILVTVNPIALVDAGTDYAVCQPVSIPLSGTIGGASVSATWQIVSGSGTISGGTTMSGTTASAIYTVGASDVSTTVVFKLVTNDPDGVGIGCNAVSDLLNVSVNKAATITTFPPDKSICEPNTIPLSATIGGGATKGTWSVFNGTGLGSILATNVSGTTVSSTYLTVPADITHVVTFQLATDDPDGIDPIFGPCPIVSQNYNVTVDMAAKVTAPLTLSTCSDSPSIILGGTIGGSATTAQWTGGAGSYSNVTDPNATYTISASETPAVGAAPIQKTLTLTAYPSGATSCPSVSKQTTITINSLPIVGFSISGAPGNNIANNDPPATLNGFQSGGTFTSSPSTAPVGLTTKTPFDVATFDPSVAPTGTNSILYTYIDANHCTNSITKNITVTQVTTINFYLKYPNAGFLSQDNTKSYGEFNYEVCSEIGDIDLIGDPFNYSDPYTKFDIQQPSNAPFVPNLSSHLVFAGGNWKLKTAGLPAGSYDITYYYRDANGTPAPKIRTLDVLAHPTADINVSSTCVTSGVQFNDASAMPAVNPFGGYINQWLWNLDDNLGSSQQNPFVFYDVSKPGRKHITLSIYTNRGCTAQDTTSLVVGDFPIPDFNWSSICTFDKTNFNNATTFKSGQGNVTNLTWNFGDGTVISGPKLSDVTGIPGTIGIFNNPKHTYTANGAYTVSMTVQTDVGCIQTKTDTVRILLSKIGAQTPTLATPYLEKFNATDGGWIPEFFSAKSALSDSWVWGLPAGNFATPADGGKVWWTGANIASDNTTGYYVKESSAVNGPCFDLTQLDRPMISLDYWVDAVENYDGAVLEYSTNGGLDWTIVGPVPLLPPDQRDQGINWYKPGATIVGKPGDQKLGGPYGWTGRSGQWLNGRFNLDVIPDTTRRQVRLRIAFGSNGPAPGSSKFGGFAFDNVYVGEKTRNVLIEHFTNANLTASIAGDNFLYTRDTVQEKMHHGKSDFSDIQYHVRFPKPDIFDVQSTGDASARALFYQAQQAPYTVMDGVQSGKFSSGDYNQLSDIEIDRRALKSPEANILNLGATATSSTSLNATFTIQANDTIDYPLIANIALIEKQVVVASDPNAGTYRNVVRKLLFGSDGIVIPTKPFYIGDTYTFTTGEVGINTIISDPANLMLVAFVQNFNTKEFLQSALAVSPTVLGEPITAVENPSKPILSAEDIMIYPNPANGKFNFGLPGDFPSGCIWKISDQRGVNIMNGDFADASNGVKTVDITGLTNGVYLVAIAAQSQVPVYKKLVVLNSN
jgi:hypothetical protein